MDVSLESNIKVGFIAASGVFLLYSAFQFKDGLFVRPHPILWRILTGAAVLYMAILVFLLFQKVEDVRLILKAIDPSLGVPLPKRSYAEHCELYTPNDPHYYFRNLIDTINDEFFAAHFFGWFGKALLLRDAYLCWILSVLFEIFWKFRWNICCLILLNVGGIISFWISSFATSLDMHLDLKLRNGFK